MRKRDEQLKDEIQKFYYDYFLARFFGWEVAHKPYALIQPIAAQMTKLARHMHLREAEVATFLRAYAAKQDLLAFAGEEVRRTYAGDLRELMVYPDHFDRLFEAESSQPVSPVHTIGEDSFPYAYYALIELEVAYALAELFRIDTNPGAPYRVLAPKANTRAALLAHLELTPELARKLLASNKAKKLFHLSLVQQAKAVYSGIQTAIFLNPHETIARYLGDF